MGSDFTLAILKLTVKKGQTASVFTFAERRFSHENPIVQSEALSSCSFRLPLHRTILNRSQSAESERSNFE